VQIIKRDPEKGGVLKLGTEIVSAKDGSIAALLGASPGASTAAPIMLNVLEKVFAQKVATPEWQAKIRQIVPSYGTKLNDDAQKAYQELVYTSEHLQLTPPPQPVAASQVPATTGSAASAQGGVLKPVPDMAP
jgi:malate dehydrogenase (quinone)